jgi:hypothetical protein
MNPQELRGSHALICLGLPENNIRLKQVGIGAPEGLVIHRHFDSAHKAILAKLRLQGCKRPLGQAQIAPDG